MSERPFFKRGCLKKAGMGVLAILGLMIVLAVIGSLLPDDVDSPLTSEQPTSIPFPTFTITPADSTVSDTTRESKAQAQPTEPSVPPTATSTRRATPGLPDTPVPAPHFIVNREQVNVRGGPGTAFSIVGVVEQGARFDIIGRNEDGSWLEFCCVNGQRGWIYAQILIVSEELASIALAANIPDPPPTATPQPPTATPVTPPQPAPGGTDLGRYDNS